MPPFFAGVSFNSRTRGEFFLRKIFLISLTFLLIFSFSVLAQADEIKIGACIYRFNDAFMLRFRNAMSAESEKLGAKIEIADGRDDQTTQNEQIDAFINDGVNVLIINPVDRMAAQSLIDKAKEKNIPVVFINREPTEEMLASYEKAYYVGAKAEESGTEAGELIAEYFKAHPEADKNHDRKIQFVLLKGQNGHQDMILRSKYSVEAIKNAGFEPVEIASAIANWDKLQAMQIMNAFTMAIGPENIEAVIANNDEMALGAIEALKNSDYNKGNSDFYIPVVGVDANASALDAMDKGEMLGTVLNDADNQGAAAVRLANALATGGDVKSIGYEITDNKYIWIPYQKVTRGENK
ncbi:MAG: galactose ABC transporter substrate-binding protein [Synergistaceae bacterium]|nr:galactose ABC transporter substrate-binding protein [Synergistaceae bacterium]